MWAYACAGINEREGAIFRKLTFLLTTTWWKEAGSQILNAILHGFSIARVKIL
jgi:hypothetical protein